MKKHILHIALIGGLLSSTVSCNRFLDVTPTGVVIPESIADYRAILTNAYNTYPAHRSVLQYRTDEVTLNTDSYSASYAKDLYTWNDTNPDPTSTSVPYDTFYKTIMYLNQVINEGGRSLPDNDDKKQLLGEAYALRAMTYFELANIYAPVYSTENASKPAVPLVLETDLEATFPKSTLEETYNQILNDINQAKSLVNVKKQAEGFNYRFTEAAVHSLAARVYLYKGDWQKVVNEATIALQDNSQLEDFNSSSILPVNFRSVESVMNLDKNVDYNISSVVFASPNLIALYDQANDLRFAKYFKASGNKFKTAKYDSNGYNKSSFRVSETMLMKAEALARLNQDQAAKDVLLSIAAKRYNTQGYNTFKAKIDGLAGSALLTELLAERQRETAFDGLRWYDLRRTTQPQIEHNIDTQKFVLQKNDVRYTLVFPASAKKRNPNL